MAQINLLPWREELREQRKKEFLIGLGLVAVVGIGILFTANIVIMGVIEGQNARNNFLKQEITVLDRRINQIKDLKSEKEKLTARMEVISSLQGDRPIIVRIFDQLVRTLNDGVYFTNLVRTGSNMSVQGIAESNTRVSELMRRIDNSVWFTDPSLEAIKRKPDEGDQASEFSLNVVQTKPKAVTEQATP